MRRGSAPTVSSGVVRRRGRAHPVVYRKNRKGDGALSRARAVLFDLDGTLLDSLEDLADAMNQVLGDLGMPRHPLDAYRYFVGEGMEVLVRRALPDAGWDDRTFASALSALRVEYDRRCTRKTRPYPGIPELLDALAERGLPFGILSNKPHDATVAVTKLLLPRWRFAAVLGARADVPKKPDPAGALEVADILGLTPREVLYLGDTPTDMRTARSAGMQAVGVLWGFRPAQELREGGASILVERPRDVLGLLRGEADQAAAPESP
ncbi:MAG: HAD family hydrolase [Deferrisomatales bacterium]